MKMQIGSLLLNKQGNGISGITKKTKGHKDRLGLGTLTLNRGISSQGSGAARHASQMTNFFQKHPEDESYPQSDPSARPKARGLLHMEREYIARHIRR